MDATITQGNTPTVVETNMQPGHYYIVRIYGSWGGCVGNLETRLDTDDDTDWAPLEDGTGLSSNVDREWLCGGRELRFNPSVAGTPNLRTYVSVAEVVSR